MQPFVVVFLAEREGFEPPEPLSSTVFKTAAIDHSAIFPATKVVPYFHFTKFRSGIRRASSRRAAEGVRRRKTALCEGGSAAGTAFAALLPQKVLPVEQKRNRSRFFEKILLTLSNTVRILRQRLL